MKGSGEGMPGSGGQGLSDEVVRDFLQVLERVRVEEMPCSHVFELLDQYVDSEVRGEAAARLMPLLREHFDLCHNCCEEYEALLSALEQSARPHSAGVS
jgi:hypothetical protein